MKRGLTKLIFTIIFSIIFSLILANFLLAEENQSFPQSTNATSTDLTTTTDQTSTTTFTLSESTTTLTNNTSIITTDQMSTTTSTSTLLESITTTSTTTTTITSNTTSTNTTTDQTNAIATSTIQTTLTSSNPENLTEETAPEEEQTEPSQPELPPEEPLQPPPPALKQRKLEKEIKIDFSAPYSCKAKNFSIDISNKNQAVIELELLGTKPQNSTLEIGNLPLGIDITFLNTANYTWNPLPNETTAVLQITNQPGSQKGNFNIVIIYTDNSTQKSSICQINIVHL